MASLSSLALTLLLGVAIGVALGMLGGGGSILTVPILVYILRQDPHTAVATSLVIVGANAVIGAWMHFRAGHVNWRAALPFGAMGLVAAFGGARLARLVSGPLLLTLFALLMLVVAIIMLRQKRQDASETNKRCPVVWWQVVLAGAAIGFLTGFLGVGGGFLVVPALVLLLRMDMRDAVGSSLVVIAMNSAAGLLGHLGDGQLPWATIAWFLVGGLTGLVVGLGIAKALPPARLRQAFATFVIALGITLLGLNLPLLLRS